MIVEISMPFVIRGVVKEYITIPDSDSPTAHAKALELRNERKAEWFSMGSELRDKIVLATIQKDSEGKVIRWFEGECNVANQVIRLGRPPEHVVVEMGSDEDSGGS